MGLEEGRRGKQQNHHLHQKKYSCRPPGAPASAYPCCQAVPLWEKKYCTDECRIPWWKICETKKLVAFMYTNVMAWDDSAGEEAINDAKCRYWATINGLPCDVALPDPDMYVDAVDHDACIGELGFVGEDFHEQASAVTDDEASDDPSPEPDSIPNHAVDIWIPVSGRGDEEDPVPAPVSGWGDAQYSIPVSGRRGSDAEDVVVPSHGCGDHQDAVPVGWDGINGGRKDKPWKQLKSFVDEQHGRHDMKINNSCRSGKRIWLP